MPKGIPNKRYTPEFKKMVVETMRTENLSYVEAARRFKVSCDKSVASWDIVGENLSGGRSGRTFR